MIALDLVSRWPPSRTGLPVGVRGMPRRHKLMLLLAFEILIVGFRQAELRPHRPGVTVETPARPGHVIV